MPVRSWRRHHYPLDMYSSTVHVTCTPSYSMLEHMMQHRHGLSNNFEFLRGGVMHAGCEVGAAAGLCFCKVRASDMEVVTAKLHWHRAVASLYIGTSTDCVLQKCALSKCSPSYGSQL